MPENREAAEVYMVVRNQFITAGLGQVIDVSIPAVKIVMDLFGVLNQKECLLKVLSVFHHFKPKNNEQP